MGLSRHHFLGEARSEAAVDGCSMVLTGYSSAEELEAWHSHDQASISLLLKGGHDEYMNGRHFKRLPGDLKFIAAGDVHRCDRYAQGTAKINLAFRPGLLDNVGSLLAAGPDVKFKLLRLYQELNEHRLYGEASAEMQLAAMLHGRVLKPKKTPPWIHLLTELLHDEWAGGSNLQELSRKIGVHPVTISRYFPFYFSATLSEYMRKLKIDRSLALVADPGLSLTAIAYQCGFADQAHFTRTFKAVTGYLPGHFRKI